MAQTAQNYISPAEYLRLERDATEKHEYFDGQIFLMAGGTESHNLVSGNVLGEFKALLRGSGCRSYPSDQRIYVPAYGLCTYPDVSVICGPNEYAPNDRTSISNPILLVEVLSKSTEKGDRRTKFWRYATLPTLQSYLLIDQDEPFVEHWQRAGDKWLVALVSGLTASVSIEPLRIELPMARIYEDVEFDAPADA